MNRKTLLVTAITAFASAVIGAATVVFFLAPPQSASALSGEAIAAAGAPTVMTYQGYLTDAGGAPLDGSVNLVFTIYPTQASGTVEWTETHGGVEVEDGYFTVLLGETTALDADVFSGTERWLEVTVNGTPMPRQRIASAPFTQHAEEAASVPWSGVTGKPAYTTRWPAWGEVTGKPGTFPPESHDHSTLGCRVRRAATQSIPNGVDTALIFDTEVHDTDSCWSGSNPSRLYAQTAGYYIAGAGWGNFDSLSGFDVLVQIRRNNYHYLASQSYYRSSTWGATVSVSTGMFYMNAGDYIEAIASHGRGSAMNTGATASWDDRGAHAWLTRIQ